MEEKKIYYEIPGGKNKFHSAILTTYSFNFHHFEYQTLKTLKQKWIINIGVLVDANKLDEVLGFSSGGLKQMTKSYSVNGVHSTGAFHPKINFLIGDKHMLLVLGSGNLTPGGQGKNHETFSALYADEEDSPLVPVLNEAYEYVKSLGDKIEGFSSRRIKQSIPKNCFLLNKPIKEKHVFTKIDQDLSLALLYNDESSIYKQVHNLLPVKEVNKIIVLSPYYDKDGMLLTNLLDDFINASIEVYLPEENGLPPVDFIQNKRVDFYSWEETKRAQKKINTPEKFDRKLHSKLFLFETDNANYFVIGSANATVAAYGTKESRGVNDEFCLMYKSKHRDFFKELGVTGKKQKVDPNKLLRETIIAVSSPDKEITTKKSIYISSCDLDKSILNISYKSKSSNSPLRLQVFNDFGDLLFELPHSASEKIKVSLTSEVIKMNPAYIQIADDIGNVISNKQIINTIDKLFETDPSIENRTIRGVRNALEIGKINEFELMDYLNIIRSKEEPVVVNYSPGTVVKETEQEVSATMTYGEAMEASKNKNLESKLMSQHSSVQFWQTINSVLKERFEAVQNTLIDEEEVAIAESSNDRQSEKEEKLRIIELNDKKIVNKIITRTENLTSNYIKAIEASLIDNNLKINEVVFCQFLLVGHILTVIHHFNNYELPKDNKGKFTVYTPEQWKKILKGKYSDFLSDILNVFAKLCLSHRLVDTLDDNFRKDEIERYKQDVLLYVLLFHFFMNDNWENNPRVEMNDLAVLTIFNKLGFPTEESIEKLELVAKSESDELFNINKIKRLRNRIQDLQERCSKKEGYFFHPSYGVCCIHEQTKNQYKFRSVFSRNYFNFIKIN